MTKGHQVYMPGKNGPFRCDHCVYYVGTNQCNNQKIVALAHNKQFGLYMLGRFAAVDPGGCSDEFEPRR